MERSHRPPALWTLASMVVLATLLGATLPRCSPHPPPPDAPIAGAAARPGRTHGRAAVVHLVDTAGAPVAGVALQDATTGASLGVSNAAGVVRLLAPAEGLRVTARPWPSIPEAVLAARDVEATIEVTRPCPVRFDWTVDPDVQPAPATLQVAHPPWTVDLPMGAGGARLAVPCGPGFVSTSPGPVPTAAEPYTFHTDDATVAVRIFALPMVDVEVVDAAGRSVPDARVDGAARDPGGARWRIADPSPTCLVVGRPGGPTVRVCPGDPAWATSGTVRVTLPDVVRVVLTCEGSPCAAPMAASCVGGDAAGSCERSGGACTCPTSATGVAGIAGRYAGWTGAIRDGTADLRPGTGALRLVFDGDPTLFDCPAMRLLRSDGADWVGGVAPACEGPGTAAWPGLGPGRYAILAGDGGDWSWIAPVDLGDGEARTVSAPRPADTVPLDVAAPAAPGEWVTIVRAGPFWSRPTPLASPHTSMDAPVGASVLVVGVDRSCTFEVRSAGPATCDPVAGPTPDLAPPP